jgi:phage terminase Nu1 subunit (DNA packaging protein)
VKNAIIQADSKDINMLDPGNKGYIDINDPNDANILAGILGISVQMVYGARKDGKLPAHTNATYKECIQQYIQYYKSKIANKANSMYEAKMEQDIKNGVAKEQMQWLEIKKQKQEVVDVQVLSELIQPIFQIIKSNLVNISRKFPETEKDIDRAFDSLYSLGNKIAERATLDADTYVQEQLEKEIDVQEVKDRVLSTFGIE